MFKKMWGFGKFRISAPKNDNDLGANWLNAKALYDEAHEHLKLYEKLYAQAHAIDMSHRQKMANGGRS